MPKPGSGGGPGSNIFDLNLFGPPPGDLTVAKNHWIDLGLIPTGQIVWFGNALFTSPDKSITFQLRTNEVGESAGTDGKTDLLGYGTVNAKKGILLKDFFRRGRLHIATIVGGGTEHFWLRLKSRKAALGAYLYNINYTLE